jgi:hypothetical protein
MTFVVHAVDTARVNCRAIPFHAHGVRATAFFENVKNSSFSTLDLNISAKSKPN